MRKRRAIRWSVVVLASIAGILIVAYFAIPPIVEPILAKKLQAMVAEHLKAQLAMSDLSYRIPFTLHVKNARLLLRDRHDVPALLSIDELDLTLARIPRKGQPLVIRALDVHHPKVTMIRAQSGELIGQDIVIKQEPKKPRHKLSDMFELRRVKLDDGEVHFEDRTRPSEPAMTWNGINADLNITPKDKALYDYHFTVNNEPLATLDAAGTMQIDELVLAIDRLALHAAVAPNQRDTHLPATVQKVVDKLKITGDLTADATARIPFRDKHGAEAKATLKLRSASAQFKDLPIDHLSMDVNLEQQEDKPPLITLASDGTVTGSPLHVDRNVIRIANGGVVIQDAHARYGQDDIQLANARIIPGHPSRLVDLAGQIDFHAPSPIYPRPLEKLVPRLNPTGLFQIVGWSTLDKPLSMADLTITAADARLTPSWRPVPFEHVHGTVHVDATNIELRDVVGQLDGGTVTLTGPITTPRPHNYVLNTTVNHVDVEALAKQLRLSSVEKRKLTGELFGKAEIRGSGSVDGKRPIDLMQIDGEAECHQSDLWGGRVLSDVAGQVNKSNDPLQPGEAAAVFSVRDRVVDLKSAAISSPLLGLQGTGTISFDHQLDLNLVVAPLGDWKQDLKRLKIPIVSDVTAEIAGAVQKLLSAATRTLLYQFHVTGNSHDPKITPIPAPILTQSAAAVFGQMTKENQKEHGLIESIRPQK